ncbi:universal stress protein [Marivivens marinus]|uniref:universal stress protein n=1 Tax=Marivivens marinus TaxID=3110173 RepID=UPI003B8490E2
MFEHIMVPVDLHLPEEVERALNVTADLARHYRAKVTLVSVTGSVYTDAPHSKADAAPVLAKLAADMAGNGEVEVETKLVFSTDVPAEVDTALHNAVEETGADLVIAGSHAPNWVDYLIGSHAGKLAARSKVSVFVVR